MKDATVKTNIRELSRYLKRRIPALVVFLTLLFVGAFMLSDSDEQGLFFKAYAAKASVNYTDVDLYAMSSEWSEHLKIPSGLKKKVQLKVTGASKVTYSVVSGDSVKVSKSGLVEPNTTTWYWYGNIGITSPIEGQTPTKVTVNYNFGKTKILVNADKEKLYVAVNLVDYADYYVDQKIDNWIADKVKSTMTAKEKITEAAKMAASYDYSVYYSSANGMVICGGGDCWASTDLIIRFCQKLGYSAWGRNGNRDSGSGSGHMNAMVKADGKYYEVEAGYVGNAPRLYTVTLRKSLFSYRYDSSYDGICVYQYDGKTPPKYMNIPETIDGNTVVGIGESFVSLESGIEVVTLPYTLKYIEDSAFNSCEDLSSINIPAEVESIGNFVFTNCNKLTDISCDNDNKHFSSSGNVIYNKKKTTLLYAPAVNSITIPSSVETIENYAFYYNHNIKSVKMSSVVTIKEGGFCDCINLKTIDFGKKLKKLGNYVCAADENLQRIIIPSTLTTVGKDIFDECTKIKYVCYSGSEEDWNNLKIKSDFLKNANYYFNYDLNHKEHTYKETVTKATLSKNGEIKSECSVCGEKASSKTISYPRIFKIADQAYTGSAVKPTATVTDADGKTIPSKYYSLAYSNNTKMGTATAKITFKGYYSGTKNVTFKIVPGQVKNLKATSVKKTSLTISWSKVKGAKYYKVEQSTDAKTWKTINTVSTNSINVSGLTAGKKYQFRVRAYDSTKKFSGKVSEVLKTGTATASPEITLKSSKSKTVEVSWYVIKGASKYIVYKSTDADKWEKAMETTDTVIRLSNLTGGKRIYIKVIAVNAYGKNSSSSAVKNIIVKK